MEFIMIESYEEYVNWIEAQTRQEVAEATADAASKLMKNTPIIPEVSPDTDDGNTIVDVSMWAKDDE